MLDIRIFCAHAIEKVEQNKLSIGGYSEQKKCSFRFICIQYHWDCIHSGDVSVAQFMGTLSADIMRFEGHRAQQATGVPGKH